MNCTGSGSSSAANSAMKGSYRFRTQDNRCILRLMALANAIDRRADRTQETLCIMPAVWISMPIVNKVRRNSRVLTSIEYYYECFRNFRFIDIIPMRSAILFATVATLCVAMTAQTLTRLVDSNHSQIANVEMMPNRPGHMLQLCLASTQVPGAWHDATQSTALIPARILRLPIPHRTP